MVREVFVCTNCGKQGAKKSGECKKCGPTQVMCLDDFAREQEKRPKKDQIKIT